MQLALACELIKRESQGSLKSLFKESRRYWSAKISHPGISHALSGESISGKENYRVYR